MAGDAALAQRITTMAGEARRIGSPFYARLCELLADDASSGGPAEALLGPTMDSPFDDYHVVRLLDGVHWLVLEGSAPELEPHYPSVGGDGDADAAWPALRQILADPPREVTDALAHPPQTNEPARSTALVVGLLEVAARFGLPLSLLELGASGGLNLHLDRYRFEADREGVGPLDSPVQFHDRWLEGSPRFDAPFEVVRRRGCDLYPVDLSVPSERTRLLSYVWPDETSRFALNREAVGIASEDPVAVDEAPADRWLADQLPETSEGVASVVLHSLVWLYLDEATQRGISDHLHRLGAHADEGAPLAWLRYEQDPDSKDHCLLRLTTWPDGEDRLLARGGHHDTPVTLLA